MRVLLRSRIRSPGIGVQHPAKLGFPKLSEAPQPCSAQEPTADAVNDRPASVTVLGPVLLNEREPVDQFSATEETKEPLDLGLGVDRDQVVQVGHRQRPQLQPVGSIITAKSVTRSEGRAGGSGRNARLLSMLLSDLS